MEKPRRFVSELSVNTRIGILIAVPPTTSETLHATPRSKAFAIAFTAGSVTALASFGPFLTMLAKHSRARADVGGVTRTRSPGARAGTTVSAAAVCVRCACGASAGGRAAYERRACRVRRTSESDMRFAHGAKRFSAGRQLARDSFVSAPLVVIGGTLDDWRHSRRADEEAGRRRRAFGVGTRARRRLAGIAGLHVQPLRLDCHCNPRHCHAYTVAMIAAGTWML